MEAMLDSGGPPGQPRTPSVSSSTALDNFAQPKSVKRPRPVKSCIECRKRKLKCDRSGPCSQCQKSRRPCKYADPQENGGGSDVSDGEPAERPGKRPQHLPGMSDGDYGRPFALVNGFGHSRRNSIAIEELTARLEQLERLITERNSPTLSYRQHYSLAVRARPSNGSLRCQASGLGLHGGQEVLNLFDEADGLMRAMSRTDGFRDLFFRLKRANQVIQEEHHMALQPMTVFVDSMMPIQKRMADILPDRQVCDRLIKLYFVFSEGYYRMVHIPSFQVEYTQYWLGGTCNGGFLPRLLCMLCVAARFGTESRGLGQDRSAGIHVPTACALVRSWLNEIRKIKIADLTILQVELLLLHAQRTIGPYHQASWVQLGCVVRMAMTLELHRDPSELPSITPFQSEIRRRLWYTLLEMDLHISLIYNLPFSIREGEYTCRPPSNIDDTTLIPAAQHLPTPYPLDHPSSNRLQAYTSRTLPARLEAATLLFHLRDLDSYAPIITAGQKLESIISDVHAVFPRPPLIFNPMDKHKEWRQRILLDVHARRPLLSLYRPFALGTPDPQCPPLIEQAYLKSAMAILTYLDELTPRTEGYADVVSMYLYIMKKDVVESALGVCWFMKRSLQHQQLQHQNCTNTHSPDGEGPPLPPLPPPGWGLDNSDERYPWSVATMVQIVERTIERLIAIIPDSSGDLTDVVSLCIVFSAVCPAGIEDGVRQIKAWTKRILDASMPILSRASTASADPFRIPGTYGAASGNMNGHMIDGVRDDLFDWGNFLKNWEFEGEPLDLEAY
ncbi:fungal-specific transcription factor domain-containing protein [Cladorrhinum sp. PSN259]|nr:fungal-specific transcription factor domain-containing protein [Cladorrhinum sp. PSN259]